MNPQLELAFMESLKYRLNAIPEDCIRRTARWSAHEPPSHFYEWGYAKVIIPGVGYRYGCGIGREGPEITIEYDKLDQQPYFEISSEEGVRRMILLDIT